LFILVFTKKRKRKESTTNTITTVTLPQILGERSEREKMGARAGHKLVFVFIYFIK
jgi:hypothetical protein